MRCAALLGVVVALGACQEQPGKLCDRVRFVWPYFDLDASDDVSPEDGLQVEFELSTGLEVGAVVSLYLAQGEEDPSFVVDGVVDGDGSVVFSSVTVPPGHVTFFAETSGECGTFRAGRSTFVWEGEGRPICNLSLASGPVPVPEHDLPVLLDEHDEDPDAAGFQARVIVETGRNDMTVRIFHVDRETGTQVDVEVPSDASGRVEAIMTLGYGEQALRAVCEWAPLGLRPSSPTFVYWVEPPS